MALIAQLNQTLVHGGLPGDASNIILAATNAAAAEFGRSARGSAIRHIFDPRLPRNTKWSADMKRRSFLRHAGALAGSTALGQLGVFATRAATGPTIIKPLFAYSSTAGMTPIT